MTTVVYNADIITRTSLTNLDAFLTVLESIRSRLIAAGMNPGSGGGNNRAADNDGNTVRSSGGGTNKLSGSGGVVTSALALFRKLSEGTGGSLLLSADELRSVWEEALADAFVTDGSSSAATAVKDDNNDENDSDDDSSSGGDDGEGGSLYWDGEGDHHLFVPGKLLLLYEPLSSTSFATSSSSTKGAAPAGATADDEEDETSSVTTTTATTVREGKEGDPSSRPQVDECANMKAVWTDGTATVLKAFEVGAGGGMLTDHLTTSYYRALKSIVVD